MEANAAAIPGSGETPVAFTHTNDIAKFVVASLDLPHWPREGWIVGDKVTWNEVLEMAESVKGKSSYCRGPKST
jgi:nucleoside-diphosphate-sugar epimerase